MSNVKGHQINQMQLVSVIMGELGKQVPGLPAEQRYVNCAIDAANRIAAELAKPVVKTTPGMGLGEWLDSDDTGSSSLFMAWVLSGGPAGVWWGRGQPENNYPRDVSDFGRCRRLLIAAPDLADKVSLMESRGQQWEAVAENWDRWVELYDNAEFDQLGEEMEEAGL